MRRSERIFKRTHPQARPAAPVSTADAGNQTPRGISPFVSASERVPPDGEPLRTFVRDIDEPREVPTGRSNASVQTEVPVETIIGIPGVGVGTHDFPRMPMELMTDVVRHVVSEPMQDAATRQTAMALLETSHALRQITGAEIGKVTLADRVMSIDFNSSAADFQAILGDSDRPGSILNLANAQLQDALLVRMGQRLHLMSAAGMGIVMTPARLNAVAQSVRCLNSAVATLPPERQSRTLAELSADAVGAQFNPYWLGDPDIPGTIRSLPPELQVAPLQAQLRQAHPGLRHWPALVAAVNALPQGIGSELKIQIAHR